MWVFDLIDNLQGFNVYFQHLHRSTVIIIIVFLLRLVDNHVIGCFYEGIVACAFVDGHTSIIARTGENTSSRKGMGQGVEGNRRVWSMVEGVEEG